MTNPHHQDLNQARDKERFIGSKKQKKLTTTYRADGAVSRPYKWCFYGRLTPKAAPTNRSIFRGGLEGEPPLETPFVGAAGRPYKWTPFVGAGGDCPYK